MAKVLPRETYEEYDALLDKCEEMSVRGFERECLRLADGFAAATGETERSVWRDAITDEVFGRIDAFRAEAQARADDLFEAMCGIRAVPHDPFPMEACDARVRSAAVHIFERGDFAAFAAALVSFIRGEVRAAANEAIAEDVEKANG